MSSDKSYWNELNSIQDSLLYVKPVDNDSEMSKAYDDVFTTKQQKERDKKVTELLDAYVDGYKSKTKSNKVYKRILFIVCVANLAAFCGCFVFIICQVDFTNNNPSVSNVIQLLSVCVTFISLIIGLLQIITKYVFPEKEEEYITRIVEIIQNNDLENKKENIKVQEHNNKNIEW